MTVAAAVAITVAATVAITVAMTVAMTVVITVAATVIADVTAVITAGGDATTLTLRPHCRHRTANMSTATSGSTTTDTGCRC